MLLSKGFYHSSIERNISQTGGNWVLLHDEKGGICVLNPFQAGDSGAEVRVEAAHYSQNSRLPTCSLFSMKNVLRWWEVLGKAVCRPVVKVTQQACKNGGTTSLWFGVAACLGHLLRRHQKDLLQQQKYRSRCGSSLFCSRAKQFSPCLCRKASDVHVQLGDVPEPKSCFNMFQGEYSIRDPTSALLCLAFAWMNMNEHAAF